MPERASFLQTRPYPCPEREGRRQCPREFTSLDDLAKHIESHRPATTPEKITYEGDSVCNEAGCDFRGISRRSLSAHVRYQHGGGRETLLGKRAVGAKRLSDARRHADRLEARIEPMMKKLRDLKSLIFDLEVKSEEEIA